MGFRDIFKGNKHIDREVAAKERQLDEINNEIFMRLQQLDEINNEIKRRQEILDFNETSNKTDNINSSNKDAHYTIIEHNELSIPELLMLHYADTFYEGITNFQSFWRYEYDVNPAKILKRLLDGQYIEVGGADVSLNIKTAAELKHFLKENSLPVGGKKVELIARILNSVPEEKVNEFAKPRKYVLTEKGKSYSDKIQSVLYAHRHGNYELTDNDIKNCTVEELRDIAFKKSLQSVKLHTKTGNWGIVSVAFRNLAELSAEKGEYISALRYTIMYIFIDVSGVIEEDGIKSGVLTPGEHCCLLLPYNIGALSELIDKSVITIDQFIKECCTVIDNTKLPYSYYTKNQIKEKIINAVLELRGENIQYSLNRSVNKDV